MQLEAFTIVDGIVGLIILISAFLAFSRGFMREAMSILGWVLAAIAAFVFAPQVKPLIAELPYLRDVIGNNCDFAILAAFAVVFIGVLVVVSIFTPLFSGIVANSALGPIDRGLGFLFGIARGVVLVAVALIVYEIAVGGGEGFAQVTDSQTVVVLGDLKQSINDAVIGSDQGGASDSQAVMWIQTKYQELTQSCAS